MKGETRSWVSHRTLLFKFFKEAAHLLVSLIKDIWCIRLGCIWWRMITRLSIMTQYRHRWFPFHTCQWCLLDLIVWMLLCRILDCCKVTFITSCWFVYRWLVNLYWSLIIRSAIYWRHLHTIAFSYECSCRFLKLNRLLLVKVLSVNRWVFVNSESFSLI